MGDALTTFGLLMVGALAALAIPHFAKRISATEQRAREEQDRRLQRRYLQELDEALALWLQMLELPQFEDQMKREEAARQLSTVLLEKLWRKRCPERTSTLD